MIETTAYPRAALIGNPSDGYFGKTISFTFKNFEARVELRESKALQIISSVARLYRVTEYVTAAALHPLFPPMVGIPIHGQRAVILILIEKNRH